MSLATRCPHCNTLFKVSSGQLQLHQGQVRCGQCKQVFSGIEHLTAADSQVWQTLQLQSNSAEPFTSNLIETDGTGSNGAFLDPPTRKKPWFSHQTQPTVKRACVGMLVLALLQVAWWQRTTIAAQLPPLSRHIAKSKPGLQGLFTLPATQALRVEGSGLQAMDEHHVRLDVTLLNTTPLPGAWPYLRVELLDPQGLVLATRGIAPSQYQQRDGGTASEAIPIAPGQTVELLAYLNLQNLHAQLPETAATGFRLTLLDGGPYLP
ncbi:MAG TPA: zinc-ribbon and DUF3426 domain-containing protein [Limnobacter sp.]|nr:zinc-ribbon and DUF3426 domain-containing protein [Limnobacter sp.]